MSQGQGQSTAPISRDEILRQIKSVKGYVSEHQEGLGNRIYNAMNGLSKTYLTYKQSNGSKGWANSIVDDEGEPMWSPEQVSALEELLPITSQHGGALVEGNIEEGPGSSFITKAGALSIDELVGQVQGFLRSVDETNRQLAAAIGPVAIVNQMKTDPAIGPFPPYLPIPIKVPAGLILPGINAILETCRILVSNQFFDSSFLRSILSVVLSIFDVSRGNWRDGVMSFLGVFSQRYMVLGIIGKSAGWVYNFISPDIRSRISGDVYAGAKSMYVGAWLWLLSVSAPDFVRDTINNLIEKAKMPIEELNKSLDELEEKAQQMGDEAGVKIEFPRVPLDRIPSFADIQNFQSILHQPEIFCSPVFQMALKPAMTISPFRIMLELLNIPTTDEGIAKACKNISSGIVESITDALAPTITPKKQDTSERQDKSQEDGLQGALKGLLKESQEESQEKSKKKKVRATNKSMKGGVRKKRSRSVMRLF
jgi:hypothetical protein